MKVAPKVSPTVTRSQGGRFATPWTTDVTKTTAWEHKPAIMSSSPPQTITTTTTVAVAAAQPHEATSMAGIIMNSLALSHVSMT